MPAKLVFIATSHVHAISFIPISHYTVGRRCLAALHVQFVVIEHTQCTYAGSISDVLPLIQILNIFFSFFFLSFFFSLLISFFVESKSTQLPNECLFTHTNTHTHTYPSSCTSTNHRCASICVNTEQRVYFSVGVARSFVDHFAVVRRVQENNVKRKEKDDDDDVEEDGDEGEKEEEEQKNRQQRINARARFHTQIIFLYILRSDG